MTDPVTFPELIIATAGPIGVDMDCIASNIEESLAAVGYRTLQIKLTKEMLRLSPKDPLPEKGQGRAEEYNWKMDYANALRKKFKLSDTLGSRPKQGWFASMAWSSA